VWLCGVYQQKTTVEERLTVSDLLPATLYEASVISVGVKGTSWPSTPVTFMTYPLSNPGTHRLLGKFYAVSISTSEFRTAAHHTANVFRGKKVAKSR